MRSCTARKRLATANRRRMIGSRDWPVPELQLELAEVAVMLLPLMSPDWPLMAVELLVEDAAAAAAGALPALLEEDIASSRCMSKGMMQMIESHNSRTYRVYQC